MFILFGSIFSADQKSSASLLHKNIVICTLQVFSKLLSTVAELGPWSICKFTFPWRVRWFLEGFYTMLWPDTRKITDVVVPYFQVLGDIFIIITKVGIDELSEIVFHQALDKASDASPELCSMQPLPVDGN